jgi:hypothetical protein
VSGKIDSYHRPTIPSEFLLHISTCTCLWAMRVSRLFGDSLFLSYKAFSAIKPNFINVCDWWPHKSKHRTWGGQVGIFKIWSPWIELCEMFIFLRSWTLQNLWGYSCRDSSLQPPKRPLGSEASSGKGRNKRATERDTFLKWVTSDIRKPLDLAGLEALSFGLPIIGTHTFFSHLNKLELNFCYLKPRSLDLNFPSYTRKNLTI